MADVKALVTGAAGFLGRHFAHTLRARGWQVDGVDLRPMDYDALDWMLSGEGTFVHSEADALDLFTNPVPSVAFDLVVHCAAVEPHRVAIDGEPMHLARNLMLDAAMFEWAVRTGQGRVLYLSSSAVYSIYHQEKSNNRLLRESMSNAEAPDCDANYGWCKTTGERMSVNARAAGLPVTVVRPFSGYGEDQDERWPFGAFAARARRREDPFIVWGDGTQVRDWIHVDDLVAGALSLVDNAVDGPVNLCTGVGTSMRDLVTLMCAAAGYSPTIELRPDKPTGVAYRVGDPTLLQRWYTPTIDIATGVKRALGGS